MGQSQSFQSCIKARVKVRVRLDKNYHEGLGLAVRLSLTHWHRVNLLPALLFESLSLSVHQMFFMPLTCCHVLFRLLALNCDLQLG